MKNIYVCLPCYNEQDNIGALVSEWEKVRIQLDGYVMHVVLIDDKSTDNTLEVMRECKDVYDNIEIIEHEINRNLGGGVTTAFQHFLENGKEGDICVLMDGDNTHDPKYVISMLDAICQGADCVIASRYCEKSNTVGVPKIRSILSYGARIFYSLVLRVNNVKDYTCGYRAYRYESIEKANQVYGQSFVEMKTFACMMEVLYKLSLLGIQFAEVPFELRYDKKEGESKMRILKTVKDSVVTTLKLRWKRNKIRIASVVNSERIE